MKLRFDQYLKNMDYPDLSPVWIKLQVKYQEIFDRRRYLILFVVSSLRWEVFEMTGVYFLLRSIFKIYKTNLNRLQRVKIGPCSSMRKMLSWKIPCMFSTQLGVNEICKAACIRHQVPSLIIELVSLFNIVNAALIL